MAVQGVWQPRDVDSNTRWCKVREVMTWRAHGALLATQSGKEPQGTSLPGAAGGAGWQLNGKMTGSSMGR